jgi:hypothetical protein
MLQFFSSLDKLLPSPIPFDNNTPKSTSSNGSTQPLKPRWQKKSWKPNNDSENGFQYHGRPARLCSKQKNIPTVSEISLSTLVAEESVDRSQYEIIVTATIGLGVDWFTTESGLVYVRGFRRINTLYCGAVETSGLVHITDQLLSINNVELKSLDLLKIIDMVNCIDRFARVSEKMDNVIFNTQHQHYRME